MLFLMAVISCYSQNVIVSSCRIVDKYTYKEMGIAIFGKTGGMIISVIMLCYTILSCTSYFVIIGDMVTKVTMFFFPTVSVLQKRYIVVPIICVLFIFPLCMMRSSSSSFSLCIAVDSLKYVSVFSVLAVVVVVVVITQQFIEYHHINETVEVLKWSTGIIRVIPVICVSYNCHYNAPRYYKELKNRSPGRMWIVSIGSTIIVFVLYLLASVCGYLEFGADTDGDILNNYPSDSVVPAVARIFLLIAIVCTFPIAYFAVRNNLHTIFCQQLHFHSFKLRLVYVFFSPLTHRTAVSVLIATCTVSCFAASVEDVIGLNGSLFGSLIMLVIPGLMYLYASTGSIWGPSRFAALLLTIFGVCVCGGGTYLRILKIMHKA